MVSYLYYIYIWVNFFTFTRRKSETVRPCKMSTLPCYSELYNFTQAGSQARRMTWKRLRS